MRNAWHKQRKENDVIMNNQNNQANQQINLSQQNDQFHVMLNKQLADLDQYYSQIENIGNKLVSAENALRDIPGVATALNGIEAARQENYGRLAKYNEANQAAMALFQSMQKHYIDLVQAINNLPQPETAPQQPQIGMNNQQNSQTNQQSANN